MIPLNLILTALTNFLVAMAFIFCAGVVIKRNRLSTFFSLSFIILSIGFFLAGIAHGFYEYLGLPKTQIEIWLVQSSWTLSIIGIVFFIYVLLKFYKLKYLPYFMCFIVVFMGINTFFAVKNLDFLYIIIAYIPLVISILFFGIKNFRQKSAKYLLLGIIVTILGSIIQAANLNLFFPLDYNGVYHIFIFISAFAFLGWGLGLKKNKFF